MRKPGKLFLLVGPSRVGKDAVLHGVLRRRSLGLKRFVTATTRARRPGERDGRDYFFKSDEEFDELIESDGLFEWVHIQTHRSGVPREPLMTWLRQGKNVIGRVDNQGGRTFSAFKEFETVTIFILPGTTKELKDRLAKTIPDPKERAVRWETTKRELAEQQDFDWRVINERGKLKQTIDEVANIIKSYT